MRRKCRERFPRPRGLAIPTCITAHASRTCYDACLDRLLVVSLEFGGGENVPGIPGACATCNFIYLERSPLTANPQRVLDKALIEIRNNRSAIIHLFLYSIHITSCHSYATVQISNLITLKHQVWYYMWSLRWSPVLPPASNICLGIRGHLWW